MVTSTEPQTPTGNTEQNLPRPVRIVLAKVGLDGHDRGIKVVARGLRDAGFHVIYGGIWQSPDAVAQAVLDEDAQWLGISLLNGAHLTLIPQVLTALRQRGLEDVQLVLGGIIPPKDVLALKELGVTAIFGPGTAVPEIAACLQSSQATTPDVADVLLGLQQGDRRAMSHLLTMIAEGKHLDEIGSSLSTCEASASPETESSHCIRTIAFTGNGGVGKSSLISRLLAELRSKSLKVAVLTCDPQSHLTGGALLGDRIRMSDTLPDEGVFIRSLAVPSGSQGIARNLDLMSQALQVFGFDIVLIETAGTGQGDVAIRNFSDALVLVMQPETGDAIQWEKAGLLEIADVIVIHKSDLPGADRMEGELREQLSLPGHHSAALVRVSAAKNTGIDALWKAISRTSLHRLSNSSGKFGRT